MPDDASTDEEPRDPRVELRAYLRSEGFSDEQIAAHDSELLSLPSRRILFGDEDRVTVGDIAAIAGCDESLVRKVRLASGLPDAGDDAVCSPREAEVMNSFLVGAAVFGEEITLEFLRVLGAATAGIAEAALAIFASNRRPQLVESGADLVEIARAGNEATAALLSVPPVLDVLLRVHFENANAGRFAGLDPSAMVDVAVGFIDLVESTRLMLASSGEELARALSDFERDASDAVVGVGGRVVKRIGDAVMFVVSDPAGACAAAKAILEKVADHGQLSTARAAITWGRVLPRDGDYFGTAVNVAARAVAFAEPGAIVVDEAVRAAIAGSGITTDALGEHSLKGFDEKFALFRLT